MMMADEMIYLVWNLLYYRIHFTSRKLLIVHYCAVKHHVVVYKHYIYAKHLVLIFEERELSLKRNQRKWCCGHFFLPNVMTDCYEQDDVR